jgi:hypothetical protein
MMPKLTLVFLVAMKLPPAVGTQWNWAWFSFDLRKTDWYWVSIQNQSYEFLHYEGYIIGEQQSMYTYLHIHNTCIPPAHFYICIHLHWLAFTDSFRNKIFFCKSWGAHSSVRRLLVHRFLSPWWRRCQFPPKRLHLQEPHGVLSQKSPFVLLKCISKFFFSLGFNSQTEALLSRIRHDYVSMKQWDDWLRLTKWGLLSCLWIVC